MEAASTAAPVILAAVGLAHDLGNPPFGHQGEVAIRRWFADNSTRLFTAPEGQELPEQLRSDFLKFEGNAQNLRLVTRLQVSSGGHGLDLTAATLAALMKYTAPASRANRTNQNKATQKPGFFSSESEVVSWLQKQTGIGEGQRHPLTWLMEACDDIAYSILDIEDAIKKSIISPEDVLAYLKRQAKNEGVVILTRTLDRDFEKADSTNRASRSREIKTSYLRTRLIEMLITGAAEAFLSSSEAIFAQSQREALLEQDSAASVVYAKLKKFARDHAYNHPAVLRSELQGALAITKLLDWFWAAISGRESFTNPASARTSAFAAYVYASVSDNYRVEFEERATNGDLPIRYCELQLLTDLISGMTDSFVMQVFNDLEPLSHA
jgi:dGTPase